MTQAKISLPLARVTVLPPSDPLIRDFQIYAGTLGAPFVGNKHLHRTTVSDLFIEGAYLYRAERILGASSNENWLVAVHDRESRNWKAYPCTISFKDGFMQAVEFKDIDFPQTHSKMGVNIQLKLLTNLRSTEGKSVGDVQRYTVRDGRVRQVENIARGVRFDLAPSGDGKTPVMT